MSSGIFSDAKYASNDGDYVFGGRVQPETLDFALGGVANANAAGTVTPNLPSFTVSKSRRSIGVHPRTVSVKVTATGVVGANSVGSVIQIPVMQKSVWDGYAKGQTGVYNGDTVKYAGKSEEKIV